MRVRLRSSTSSTMEVTPCSETGRPRSDSWHCTTRRSRAARHAAMRARSTYLRWPRRVAATLRRSPSRAICGAGGAITWAARCVSSPGTQQATSRLILSASSPKPPIVLAVSALMYAEMLDRRGVYPSRAASKFGQIWECPAYLESAFFIVDPHAARAPRRGTPHGLVQGQCNRQAPRRSELFLNIHESLREFRPRDALPLHATQ